MKDFIDWKYSSEKGRSNVVKLALSDMDYINLITIVSY